MEKVTLSQNIAIISAALLFSVTAAATPVASSTDDGAYEQWLLQQSPEIVFKTCPNFPDCGPPTVVAAETNTEASADKP